MQNAIHHAIGRWSALAKLGRWWSSKQARDLISVATHALRFSWTAAGDLRIFGAGCGCSAVRRQDLAHVKDWSLGRAGQGLCSTVLLVLLACSLWLTWESPCTAACADEDFLLAEESYQKALEETVPEKKIALLEQAFSSCPSHGSHAHGYYLLAKLLYDRNENDKAFPWLLEANRFRAVMLQRSVDDLAQTNFLLGTLYRTKGEAEKALIHLNVYRALTRARERTPSREIASNPDAFFSLIYSPAAVKDVLSLDPEVKPEYRSKLNSVEVFFAPGTASLDDTAKKRLDGIGEALLSERLASCTFVVEGHTDQVGTAEANCSLAARRSAAVVDYLGARWGVPKAALMQVSFGKGSPAFARETGNRQSWPTADRFNRRVVIWNAGPQGKASVAPQQEPGIRHTCGQ
jgi:outer membrane protein OmpA-like peptidoglycan-associated protein